jgi:2-polyprenyl-3-methyl-5-hydroxy-6-metoxy-1,4-benzoquinol methylase
VLYDKSKHAAGVFDKNALLYQDKFMNVELYHHAFDRFCDSIVKPNAEVLDIACGPGNITKYLLQKRPGLKILGIDLSQNMIDLATKNNPQANFCVMDCRAINLLAKKYDAIMCGFCFPYLSKPEAIKLIDHAGVLLQIAGVFFISTMEDDYTKSQYVKGSNGDEIFMHYHQADYLCDALTKNNFEIIDMQHQPYPTNDGTKVMDLLMLARKIK